jgi:hypothetical protein
MSDRIDDTISLANWSHGGGLQPAFAPLDRNHFMTAT